MRGAVESDVFVEVDRLLLAWRDRALWVLSLVVSIVFLPVLLMVLGGKVVRFSSISVGSCLFVYACVVITALRPRWNLYVRATILFAALGVFCVMQLLTGQLSGGGRLSLLVLPLLVLVLTGTRAGWFAAAMSMVLYAVGALLVHQQHLIPGVGAGSPEGTPIYWFFQGIRLAATVIVMMVILTRLHAHQHRIMIAERSAVRRLETEAKERQRLECEIAQVSESERRMLGAELHDGLCQNLTATLLNCMALENRLAGSSPTDMKDVSCIRESIEESYDLAHQVARGLFPVELESHGLVSAVEEYCRMVGARSGVLCEFRAGPEVVIRNPDCALQLYRIVGEALANAVRHADCSRIAVRLTRTADELVLEITDNGKGTVDPDSGEGLGRRIMNYRAGLIDGFLTVSGTPGTGTTVLCRIPDPEVI